MEHLDISEWLLILGLGMILGIAFGRASKPSRPNNTYASPEDDRPSRSEQRMQNLKDKMAQKAAIKAVKTATGTSLKNAKDYVDARKEELE